MLFRKINALYYEKHMWIHCVGKMQSFCVLKQMVHTTVLQMVLVVLSESNRQISDLSDVIIFSFIVEIFVSVQWQ